MFFKVVVHQDAAGIVLSSKILEAHDLPEVIELYLDNQGIPEDSAFIHGSTVDVENIDGEDADGHISFEPWDEEEAQEEFIKLAENLNWKKAEDLTKVMHFLGVEE